MDQFADRRKQNNEHWAQSQDLLFIDVKCHFEEDIDSWDHCRRIMFLINEDAPPPFSVDNSVWSSALSEEDQRSFECPYAPLTFELEHNLLRATFGYKTLTLVNLLHLLKTDFPDQQIIGYSPNPELASIVYGEFPTLGFDVADSWRLSGICNCGYKLEEKVTLQEEFGDALNSHHLFKTERDARKFAESCDVRVDEHAPFRVFRIYDLRS